jgi:PIN domain nuclease of toxin-antitoxin system
MITAIADTHATIWYLYSDPRLGKAASATIDEAVASGNHIGISAITIAEMVYLIERGRIPSAALDDLRAAVADPSSVLRHVAFDETIAIKMNEVPRDQVPDLPDRIIGATALLYGVPVLSKDNKLRSSVVKTVW